MLLALRISCLVVVLGLLATGCWNGSNAAPTAHSTTRPAPRPMPPPPTRLTISYAVGFGDRLGICPRGAVCKTKAVRGSNIRVRVARFTLSCNPPAGTYRNPRAACAAVAGYITLRSRGPQAVCMCALEVYQDTITGTFNGRYIDLPIGPCAVCGMGRAAHRDAAVLAPTA
jgi:hypothetical protein